MLKAGTNNDINLKNLSAILELGGPPNSQFAMRADCRPYRIGDVA